MIDFYNFKMYILYHFKNENDILCKKFFGSFCFGKEGLMKKASIFTDLSGYELCGRKTAVLTSETDKFYLNDINDSCVFSGKAEHFGCDKLSGDDVYIADFSGFEHEGTYYLTADNGGTSERFFIGRNAHSRVLDDMTKAFYYLRCGCGLDEKHAGKFAHGKCHTAPALLWNDHSVSLDVSGGWHDAGDYGRYVTAGACALAHLLYAYKMFPNTFDRQNINIPESGGRLPDILAECKVELDWLLKMQRSDGAVYHKATTAHHAAFIMPEEDTAQMYVLPVSSMATADFSAVCALASGIFRQFDSEYSTKLLMAAEKSGQWLNDNPEYYFDNPKECKTGGYGEDSDRDNRFWAWAELFTATGEEKYHVLMKEALNDKFPVTALGYGSVGGLGALGYMLYSGDKDASLSDFFKKAFSDEALRLKALADSCGYGAAMDERDYCWGSNMNLMKHAMIFAIADRVCGEAPYRDYAEQQLYVLLGLNSLGFSYVSGEGENSMKNPHMRPTAADGIDECIPGLVSGGPNRYPADEAAHRLIKEGTPPMKCYADDVGAYSLNEITIYWNSPAVFAAAYIIDNNSCLHKLTV